MVKTAGKKSKGAPTGASTPSNGTWGFDDATNSDALGSSGDSPTKTDNVPITTSKFLQVIGILRRQRFDAARRLINDDHGSFAAWDPARLRRARRRADLDLLLSVVRAWGHAWNDRPRHCEACLFWLNVGQWPDHCAGKRHRARPDALG